MIKKAIKKLSSKPPRSSVKKTLPVSSTQTNTSKPISKYDLSSEDFRTIHKPTWCPGCGDFGILNALKKALALIDTPQQDICIVYGIGCHGHMCSLIHTYGFEGLHGRAIPVAEGIKLANNKLKVIIVAGDGDTYGEGMNHFISGIRANHDVTLIVHNNMVYGLTTGQTSPTSAKGFKTKSTPTGVIEVPVNPLALALAAGGGFVARGFSLEMQYLTDLFVRAIKHDGFSLVDVFQNCETFNKVNTINWFRERVYHLEDTSHDFTNHAEALTKAFEFADKIPIGVFYQDVRRSYQDDLPVIKDKPLLRQPTHDIDLSYAFKKLI